MDKSLKEREEFLLRMGEVAALEPADPLREAVQEEVTRWDEPVQNAWKALMAENEVLQREFARVTPPPGLAGRLLALPENLSARKVKSPSAWWLTSACVAATLIMVFGIQAFMPGEAPAI